MHRFKIERRTLRFQSIVNGIYHIGTVKTGEIILKSNQFCSSIDWEANKKKENKMGAGEEP